MHLRQIVCNRSVHGPKGTKRHVAQYTDTLRGWARDC
jgi:hypothetical protein